MLWRDKAWAELGVGREVAELGAARGCQDQRGSTRQAIPELQPYVLI